MKLADVFQSGMVLQREKPIHFFGSAEEPEISVFIDGVDSGSCIPEHGQFLLETAPQKASWDSRIEFRYHEETLAILEHVRFGEVWLAGGQSNMEFAMHWDENYKAEKEHYSNRHLFYYEVPKIYSDHQLISDVVKEQGKWFEISADTLGRVSAVAYYFSCKLREVLPDIPIGIISCNFGGSYIMSWLPEDILAREEAFQWHWQKYLKYCRQLDMTDYEKQYLASQKASNTWFYEHLLLPIYFKGKIPKCIVSAAWKKRNGIPVENDVFGPWDSWRPAGLYEYMLKKVTGFTIRGVIWYQGEAEAESRRVVHYYAAMKCLIEDWRKEWRDAFPFLIVKLAGFERDIFQDGINYPRIRVQQQKLADNLSGVYTVSAEGYGEPFNIHPPHKKPVGEQLADTAKKEIYQL